MKSRSLKALPCSVTALLLMALLSTATAPVFAAAPTFASFAQISLYPNIETIGIVVNGLNLPKAAQMTYRASNDPDWHPAHPLMRIDDGRLVGSLFGLSASTSYEVKVTDGATEIGGSTTTQSNDLPFTPTVVLHVSASAAAGGDGSAAAPFQKIQDGVNHAGPGTQVLVADGVYREAVTFPASGSAGNWIQVKAEGSGAILDGSETLSGDIWKPDDTKAHVWFMKIGAPIKYLARDGLRFYNYDTLADLMESRGHNKVPMNEGWFIEQDTWKLYVRSVDNPANHAWEIPRLNRAFDVAGMDWIWIEGFEMRYYGANEYGCGVCTLNASQIVVRRNRIHNIQLGVYVNWTGGEDRGNDSRIEFNEIYDPDVMDWPWSAVKGSAMEGTAIVVRGHIGAIVRSNELHQFFNGIYVGSSAALENPGIAFDTDVYNNHIYHITDDGLEPEGACINNRFRNNNVDSMLVGISLAPVTQGPAWVLRSLFTNYTGRAIKWDANSDGVVLIYHNTSWTNVGAANAMDLISPVYNAVMRNNIFQTNASSIEEVRTGSTGHDWNNDNWYTTRGTSGYHFKWENVPYNTIGDLCTATGLECKGYEDVPGFTNPAGGDFTLLPTSPDIDRGVLIPGINDNFAGSAPDVGVYESARDAPPVVTSITRVDANPTAAASVNFTVTFSEPVNGVDLAAPFSDFALTVSPGITGASIASVTPVAASTYTVNVNTGAGNGTIRLDIVDDDSILDSGRNPLGGPGVGNGTFVAGDSYTVDKTIPAVISILRTDPTPTAADAVHFAVTFSEEVTGVDASDFAFTVTGSVAGPVVTEVIGSGSSYSITVDTGVGDGTLRLDLVDNDSILDARSLPLGGAGAGNGNFSVGEVYTINRNLPAVVGILRTDTNPSSAANVHFAVTFSEAVTGVDAADFAVSAIGVSGAGILDVTGSGNLYIVNLGTGSGDGSLRLDVIDNDSILDSAGAPLGGPGAGNGNFAIGETYTITRPAPPPVPKLTMTFRSNGANDGWILESGESTGRGGTRDANAPTFNLGDDARDRQYRAILHFPTSALPDNAVVTMVILSIKKQDRIGTDPFTTHGNILIDIRYGAFGSIGPFPNYSLQITDFQEPADKAEVGTIQNNPVSGWYWSALDPSAFPFINLKGVTQFRLRFQLDDNDDLGNDYLKFYSGNANKQTDRPQLLVEYYVP